MKVYNFLTLGYIVWYKRIVACLWPVIFHEVQPFSCDHYGEGEGEWAPSFVHSFLPLLQIPPKKEKGKVGKGKDFFVPAEEGEKKLKVPEVAHLSQKLWDRRKGGNQFRLFLLCTFTFVQWVNSGIFCSSSMIENKKRPCSKTCGIK